MGAEHVIIVAARFTMDRGAFLSEFFFATTAPFVVVVPPNVTLLVLPT